MKNFFLSLKTTVWLLSGLICVFFIGSYMMPVHRDIFGPMNDRLLFDWVALFAFRNPWQTWWFFAALAGLILLAANTIVCSLQAIRGRWSRRDFLLRISPQIVHIGFLFILLAHLLGAGSGYKLSGMVPEGAYAGLPGDTALYLKEVRARADATGRLKDWAAEVYIFENNQRVAAGVLGPNKPLFFKGAGFYLKSFELEPSPVAFLVASKDPGAIWALVGAVLFMLGSIVLLVLKWKKA